MGFAIGMAANGVSALSNTCECVRCTRVGVTKAELSSEATRSSAGRTEGIQRRLQALYALADEAVVGFIIAGPSLTPPWLERHPARQERLHDNTGRAFLTGLAEGSINACAVQLSLARTRGRTHH